MTDRKLEKIEWPPVGPSLAPLRAILGWGACLFAAVVLCFWQFRADHFGPLAAAAVILVLVCFFRPRLALACLLFGVLGVALFLVDVFWLRHRLAVSARIREPFFQNSVLLGVYPSPSGKSTVYFVSAGFADPADVIYVSDGGWFPRFAYDGLPPSVDLSAPPAWSGSLFTLRRLRYDEATGQITGRITGPPVREPAWRSW